GALLFAASGVFSQLQVALNRAWNVRLKTREGLVGWVRKRFLSLGAIGVLAFLTAMSFVTSTAVEIFGLLAGDTFVMQAARFCASVILFAALFAAIFRFLPDVEVTWRDVAGGAAVTALMFTIAQYAIRYYLSQRQISVDYGAVGTAIVVLLWVYLGASVLLAGAELTQAWVHARGRELEPNEYAVRIGDDDGA
ncbi:MAG: YihY/virulence factor BrkB family protein, partial [Planctomycetes bacterium]|nr:YihY/virulence factor BrkB family protein [Planctomycetota bacterium]